MTDVAGGPALPASISSEPPAAGPALRVYRDDDAPVTGGPATPVYVVSDGEVAAIGVQGNVPIPLAVVSGRPTTGARPIPVYVVNGAAPLDPFPAAIVASGPVVAWAFDDPEGSTEAAPLVGDTPIPVDEDNLLGFGPAPFGGLTQTELFISGPAIEPPAGLSLDEGSVIVAAYITVDMIVNFARFFRLRAFGGVRCALNLEDQMPPVVEFARTGDTSASVQAEIGGVPRWSLFAATWSVEDDQIKLSVDGGTFATASGVDSAIINPQELSVADLIYDGAQSVTAIYDRVLTQSEIDDLYAIFDAEAPPGPPAGLLFQVTARDSTVTRDGSNLVSAVADDYSQVGGFTAAGGERPTYNATAGPGGVPALIFAGAQRLIMDEASAGQANFALECWGWVDDATTGAQMWIGSDQDLSNYYVNLYPAPNALASYLESGLSNAIVIDPTNIVSATWHYAVIVKIGTAFRLYLDGAEVATALATAGADPTPGYGWQIGNSTLNEPLTGRVHQVAWWNIAPSGAQVAARYAVGPRAADGSGF